ncbi:beta-ketoacyl-ACP synthase, partial [Klebsiella pneumoniae]|nr:beta-ketoacyl-ACP synthase [Klebsiella pneumoniae]
RCNPFSTNRNGINIGEAAVLFLMSREPAPIALLGSGASCDAHHISAPEPSGKGALLAMRKALASAKLSPEQIGYLN